MLGFGAWDTLQSLWKHSSLHLTQPAISQNAVMHTPRRHAFSTCESLLFARCRGQMQRPDAQPPGSHLSGFTSSRSCRQNCPHVAAAAAAAAAARCWATPAAPAAARRRRRAAHRTAAVTPARGAIRLLSKIPRPQPQWCAHVAQSMVLTPLQQRICLVDATVQQFYPTRV